MGEDAGFTQMHTYAGVCAHAQCLSAHAMWKGSDKRRDDCSRCGNRRRPGLGKRSKFDGGLVELPWLQDTHWSCPEG